MWNIHVRYSIVENGKLVDNGFKIFNKPSPRFIKQYFDLNKVSITVIQRNSKCGIWRKKRMRGWCRTKEGKIAPIMFVDAFQNTVYASLYGFPIMLLCHFISFLSITDFFPWKDYARKKRSPLCKRALKNPGNLKSIEKASNGNATKWKTITLLRLYLLSDSGIFVMY